MGQVVEILTAISLCSTFILIGVRYLIKYKIIQCKSCSQVEIDDLEKDLSSAINLLKGIRSKTPRLKEIAKPTSFASMPSASHPVVIMPDFEGLQANPRAPNSSSHLSNRELAQAELAVLSFAEKKGANEVRPLEL